MMRFRIRLRPTVYENPFYIGHNNSLGVDLASVDGEHVPGTPDKYKHGWILANPDSAVKDSKRYVVRSDDKRRLHAQTKGNFVHPVTGHAMGKSEIGDTYEHLFAAKGQRMVAKALQTKQFRMIAGAQKKSAHVGADRTSRTTALDFAFNHSHGGEVKTLSSSSKSQKTAIKAEEVARKNEAVKEMGVKPLLIAQIVDQKTNTVHVYMHPAFESKAVSKMIHLGSYKYSAADFHAAQVNSGHAVKAARRAATGPGAVARTVKAAKGDTLIETHNDMPYISTVK